MKISRLLIFGTALLCVTAAVADPPKLVSTSPSFWAVNVNPLAQKTIALKFDQRLRAHLTDWIGLDVLSPPSDLQTKFSADGMSCSIDVQLQPGKVYICGLNERGLPGVGFQNEKGFALPPTYLVFQTAGTPGPNDVPARIVRSNPPNAMQSVDSTRTMSITVTFDKPMSPKKHGLHLYENNQLLDISKLPFSYSADGMTFILPCRLKPATLYRLELNSNRDIGFSRTTRVPLWPAVISFSTR